MATRLVLSLAALTGVVYASTPESECRCFPGDACWPAEDVWSSFNASVGGKLIKTVPIGSVCHDPNYDEEACKSVQSAWFGTDIHIDSSHSVMAPYFANQSCDPFTPREAPCVIGAYVQYAVNSSGAVDIAKTIKFAEDKNIRLVIRNTAHDYLGKSTGAGALAVWTHNMKESSKLSWDDKGYTGPAFKFGAGIMGFEAVHFTHQHNLLAVTGHCPTVGIVGGHMQGGGHGPLSSKYGLAPDNVLEFEVVDAQGSLLVANSEENSDLFWALSGGGGATYGVVTSMTVKAYPDTSLMFGSLMIPAAGVDEETFWEAVARFHALFAVLVDVPCFPVTVVTKDVFMVQEMTCPDLSEDQVNELLKPFLDFLDGKGVEYQKTMTAYATYKDYYDIGLRQWRENQANLFQGGSWFLPRPFATEAGKNKAFVDTLKEVVSQGAFVSVLGFNVSKKVVAHVDNAVFPGWRDALLDVVTGVLLDPAGTPDDAYTALQHLDQNLVSKFRALAPYAGTYLNEALPTTVDWKKDFYGENYEKLLDIKHKYDPNHLFYAVTAVGSDYWVEKADKRLCKAGVSKHARDEL